MKRISRFLPLVIFLLLVVVLYRGLFMDPRHIPSVLLNKSAPNSKTVEAMKGHVWLLNVWASWCLACKEEHSVIMNMAASGLKIIGLAYRDPQKNAKAWLLNYGSPYQKVIFDETGDTAIDWGVYGAPETFIIDKQGVIRFKHIGIITPDVWQNKFKPLIQRLQS
jgi:cytochrome c biogenesis protein CcmG, thiol:disulfide interchange protein DsbE